MSENGGGVGPRDAAVMEAILKEMGLEEYEPYVIHQMLEFCYRQFLSFLGCTVVQVYITKYGSTLF